MTSRTKVITFFCVMAVVDMVIPVPVLAVVGAYVAITRPPWFRELAARVYEDVPPPLPEPDPEPGPESDPGKDPGRD